MAEVVVAFAEFDVLEPGDSAFEGGRSRFGEAVGV
jgi:hypothetical protein